MSAPTYGKSQEERWWVVPESSADVLAQPDIQYALVVLPGSQAAQAGFEHVQSQERNPAAGVFGFITRKFKPSQLVIPVYAKVPAYAGDVPSYDPLLYPMMGSRTLPTYATLSTSLTGANNDLVYTARVAGTAGNSLQVEYIDPGAAAQSLSVTATSTKITVNLATDGGSAITSTGATVRAAVRASTAAMALVQSVENKSPDTGAGVVTALSAANLSGGSGTAQVVYSLASSIDSITASAVHAIGNPTAMLARYFRGLRGQSMKISGSGSDEPKIEFTMMAPYMLQAGTSKASGSHNNSVTTLTTNAGQAARYSFGPNAVSTDWFWLNWENETVKATATDNSASVTIARGANGTTAATHNDQTEVTPWTPGTSTEPADVISSVAYGSITIAGVTTIGRSFEITLDNKEEPRLDEYAQPYATGFRRSDRRTVTGTINTYCTQDVEDKLTALDRETELAIVIVCKSSGSRQMSISMPRCRILQPPTFDGGGPEFTLNFPFQALQTTESTNDEISITYS